MKHHLRLAFATKSDEKKKAFSYVVAHVFLSRLGNMIPPCKFFF